jgi:hypothetical protein
MSDLETVMAWHAAVNAGDTERVVSLSTQDVEVGGPRGSGRGVDLLRGWLGRAGIQLDPRRSFVSEHGVVVEQSVQWDDADGGLTEPQLVGTVFRLREGKIESVVRYADVRTALDAAGLDPSLADAPNSRTSGL